MNHKLLVAPNYHWSNWCSGILDPCVLRFDIVCGRFNDGVCVCVCVVADVGHYPSLPPGETGKRWRDGWMGGGKGGLPGEESPINQPSVSALTWDLSARGVFVCVYVCVCVERYHNNSTALSSCQSPLCWPGNLQYMHPLESHRPSLYHPFINKSGYDSGRFTLYYLY